jgi:hypothetical protein
MKTFLQIRNLKSLDEAFKLPSGEKQVKKLKVGKGKYDAVVAKKGSSFVAYIDGDKLDTFKSAKDAEKAINDFTKLMEK